MTTWITPGWIDAIVVAVVLESAVLSMFLLHASAARLVAPLLLYLASGASLLLALRAALAAADANWIAIALLASLLTHATSLGMLYRRLHREAPPLGTPGEVI